MEKRVQNVRVGVSQANMVITSRHNRSSTPELSNPLRAFILCLENEQKNEIDFVHFKEFRNRAIFNWNMMLNLTTWHPFVETFQLYIDL